MALIEDFVQQNFERPTLQKPVVATYSTFEKDGRHLLQINTYGSNERAFPGKLSQTIQFDEVGAAKLRTILDEAFPQR